MSKFILQAAIIIGAGLVTGLTFAITSPVQLHLKEDINKKFADRPVQPKPPTGATGTTGSVPATGSEAPTGQGFLTGQEGATGAAPATGQASAPTEPEAAPAESDLYVTIEAAKAIFDLQQAVFIDARPLEEYLKGHIPNAMHLEKDNLNGPPPAKVLNYLPGVMVVVYCHGELCTDSANVIKRLDALNKDIGPFRIIKDGYPGWVKAGLPTAAGPEIGYQ